MALDGGVTESRSGRARERRARRLAFAWRLGFWLGAVLVLGVAGLFGYHAFSSRPVATTPPLASVATSVTVGTGGPVSTQVEVPNLVGMPLAQAKALLSAAGLVVRVNVDGTLPSDPAQSVHEQAPIAETVVSAGAVLTLSVGRSARAVAARKPKGGVWIVVIDPDHQSRGNPAPELIGPGSKLAQPAMTAGSTGVATQVPEYEVNLQIATNLKDRLTAAGVKVIMTRTTNDVSISNVQRVQIANSAKADLFIRLQADSSGDASATGVSTQYPAVGPWTKPIAWQSRKAATIIDGDLVGTTGARDNGVQARTDVPGFNWSKVPAVQAVTGYQSSPVEDRLLTSPRYQDQLAEGLTDGILGFLDGGQ